MNKERSGTIIEHIDEFRKRFIRCLVFVLILLVFIWPASSIMIEWVSRFLCPAELGALYYTHPMELFFLRIKISFVVSIVIAVPVIAWNIWRYVAPALFISEKKALFSACIASFLLFTLGGGLAIFGVFPILMKYAMNMQTANISPLLNISSCIEMLSWLVLGFGVCFQLPVILLMLVKLEIVSVDNLRNMRPYAVVIIFIIAAILTPPDIVSQLTMAVPSWLLFELSLVIAVWVKKRDNFSVIEESL